MDFSRLKLEFYDLLGVLLPGLFVIGEGWVFFRGWDAFVASVNQLSGAGLALLVLVAFGFGHLVQEAADYLVKAARGPRYFKKGRDEFWASKEAIPVKAALQHDVGYEITAVDTAYDVCLTKLKDRFPKRDVFLAVADLSRSLMMLAILAVIPAMRVAWHPFVRWGWSGVAIWAGILGFLIVVCLLSGRRMVRFRELSEATVFRAYLAVAKETSTEHRDESQHQKAAK